MKVKSKAQVWDKRPQCDYCLSDAELHLVGLGKLLCWNESCAIKLISELGSQIVRIAEEDEDLTSREEEPNTK